MSCHLIDKEYYGTEKYNILCNIITKNKGNVMIHNSGIYL